jgi:hypothetical protein
MKTYTKFVETLSPSTFKEGEREYIKKIQDIFSEYDGLEMTLAYSNDDRLDCVSKFQIISNPKSSSVGGYSLGFSFQMSSLRRMGEVLNLSLYSTYIGVYKCFGAQFDDEQIETIKRFFDKVSHYIDLSEEVYKILPELKSKQELHFRKNYQRTEIKDIEV